jgi:hypothetical protein
MGRFANGRDEGLVQDDRVLGDGGVIAAILIASAVSDSLDDVRAYWNEHFAAADRQATPEQRKRRDTAREEAAPAS